MSRYLSPRALGLLVVALTLVAAMVGLGLWQFGAYDDQQGDDARAALTRAPVPLDEALGADSGFPSASIGRPVFVSGTYETEEQFYVRGLVGASETFAVVTPLVTPSGSAILVVRGSSEQPSAEAPVRPVQLSGVLEPSESDGSPLDGDRMTDGIRISSLVSGITQDLYAGYIVLTASDPPDQLARVDPPVGEASRWAGFRNLLYAVQWWIFAGFVAFMWWRVVTDADEPTRERVG